MQRAYVPSISVFSSLNLINLHITFLKMERDQIYNVVTEN